MERAPSPQRAQATGAPAHELLGGVFILEGAVTVELEGAAVATGLGDFVRVNQRPGPHPRQCRGHARSPPRPRACHGRVFRNLHELWSADEPPSPEEERDLMRLYGMDPA